MYMYMFLFAHDVSCKKLLVLLITFCHCSKNYLAYITTTKTKSGLYKLDVGKTKTDLATFGHLL